MGQEYDLRLLTALVSEFTCKLIHKVWAIGPRFCSHFGMAFMVDDRVVSRRTSCPGSAWRVMKNGRFLKEIPCRRASGIAHALPTTSEGISLTKLCRNVVSDHVANRKIKLLILNRNFPPNSWQPSLEKLGAACQRINRRMKHVAVVPQSSGTDSNAFSAEDLAVCLHSVQGRSGHGTNLDQSSPDCSKVTKMFYGFYFNGSGHKTLLDSISRQLARRTILVQWLQGDASESMPEQLRYDMFNLMHKQPAEFSPQYEQWMR